LTHLSCRANHVRSRTSVTPMIGQSSIIIGITVISSIWNKTLNSGVWDVAAGTNDPGILAAHRGNFGMFAYLVDLGYVFTGGTKKWKISASQGRAVLDFEKSAFFITDIQGKPVGYSNRQNYTVSGACPTVGDFIYISGDVSSSTTCQSGNVWSVNMDYDGLTAGEMIRMTAHLGGIGTSSTEWN